MIFRQRPEFHFSPAEPADLPAAARLIADLNAAPASQCLHCPPGSAAAITAALHREENFPGGWSQWFFKATDTENRIVAMVGVQPDHERVQSWLWGPWWSPGYSAEDAVPGLLASALRHLPNSMRQVDAFLHEDNRTGLKFLQSAGFSLRPVTHIYTAVRPSGQDQTGLGAASQTPQNIPSKDGLPYLRTMHEIAFVNLHAASFPASIHTGEEILAGRDEEHIILAATDGLRLLGYACISVNYTPLEGFIEYLAVKPSARGRGVGRWLLDQTSRWIFKERNLPQAALCVTEWRDNARRLYERAGFRLSATGVGARRYLKAN